MKKSLVALAALAVVGVASAQSSVTIFGIVDASYAHTSGGGLSRDGITNSGLTEMSKAVMPWLYTMLVFLMIITYIPSISTFLPRALGMM